MQGAHRILCMLSGICSSKDDYEKFEADCKSFKNNYAKIKNGLEMLKIGVSMIESGLEETEAGYEAVKDENVRPGNEIQYISTGLQMAKFGNRSVTTSYEMVECGSMLIRGNYMMIKDDWANAKASFAKVQNGYKTGHDNIGKTEDENTMAAEAAGMDDAMVMTNSISMMRGIHREYKTVLKMLMDAEEMVTDAKRAVADSCIIYKSAQRTYREIRRMRAIEGR